MIDQQLDIARGSGQGRARQLGFSQGHPCDRLGVDRVGLAPFPGRASSPGHKLRMHPYYRMACKQEIQLEPPGQMAAVLDSQQDLAEPGNPLERLDMTGRSGLDGDLVCPASQLVDRDQRMRLLVTIDADKVQGNLRSPVES